MPTLKKCEGCWDADCCRLLKMPFRPNDARMEFFRAREIPVEVAAGVFHIVIEHVCPQLTHDPDHPERGFYCGIHDHKPKVCADFDPTDWCEKDHVELDPNGRLTITTETEWNEYKQTNGL